MILRGLIAFGMGVLLVPTQGLAAPQSFNTALPVSEGQWLLRGQAIVAELDTPAGGDLSLRGGLGVLAYGVKADITVFAALPYWTRKLTVDGAAPARETDGPGDLRLFGRYTIWQRDGRGSTLRLAGFAGLELPTGAHRRDDSTGRLPPPVQPGSGTVDPFFGLTLTRQTLDLVFDAQLAWQENTRRGGFAAGDRFQADASAQYRVLPREIGGGVPGFLYAGLEANFLAETDRRAGGVKLTQSDRRRLLLSPGLQYVTRRYVLEAQVQLPVWQSGGIGRLREDVTLRAGFRINF